MFKNIRSSTWAAIYFLLIPIYATIYSFLPYHFYHGTIQLETYNLEQKKKTILKNLTEDLTKYHPNIFISESGINIQSDGEFNFEIYFPNNFVGILEINSDSYSASIPLERKVTDKYSRNFLLCGVKHQNNTVQLDTLFNKRTFRILDRFGDASLNFHEMLAKSSLEISTGFKTSDTTSKSVGLILNKSTVEMMNEYNKGLAGLATNINGNFFRMFYFSTVTITTLGFGDIVPITDLSRFFVSSEAILGILVIGFFLNALSKETTK